MDLSERRTAYARALRERAPNGLQSVERAFAAVPREAFVGPPPWQLRRNLSLEPSETQDVADLYDDVTVALDSSRELNNGAPGRWFSVFSGLEPTSGQRVLQVGTGAGYYTALLAELVGTDGSVCGIEVDPDLALQARQNLRPWSQVEVVAGDGAAEARGPFDLIFVFAGATHVVDPWLDGLGDGGQLLLPLTCNRDEPLTGMGVGMALRLRRQGESFSARFAFPVGFYPCLGEGRSVEANTALQAAFDAARHQGLRSLRREAHDRDSSCICHLPGRCLSALEP